MFILIHTSVAKGFVSMIEKLFFVVLICIFNLQSAFALVDCGPPCSPPCGSSCTYYTCTQPATHTVEVKQVHIISDIEPGDACAHSTFTSNSLPFSVDGTEYKNLPASPVHKYLKCQPVTVNGGACPVIKK